MRLPLGEVARATEGELRGGAPGLVALSVATDSRTMSPGALFVALRADRDGHDFVAHAFSRGAVAALVEAVPREAGPAGAGPDGGGPALVVVPSTMEALEALGGLARRSLEGATVVGVTGSSGKTSTKDLTAAALRRGRRTAASLASHNNEVGVPLTLLNAPEGTEALVVEMGARGPGQIAALARMARPRAGIVTNIGAAHAELFGSLEGTAAAKGELVEALPPDGLAVLNGDDPRCAALAARSPAAVLLVGTGREADVRFGEVTLDAGLAPSARVDTPWGGARLRLRLRGAHQVANAGAALAVACWAGVALADAAAGLEEASGAASRMRLERSPGGIDVLDDAYNANPDSVAAALDALAALRPPGGPGRGFAVLGEMAELGDIGEVEHLRVGRLAARAAPAGVVAVGSRARAIAEGVRDSGGTAISVESPAEALDALARWLRPGDAVLVKASRVAGLDRLATALTEGGADR